jgi:hypothetical protein
MSQIKAKRGIWKINTTQSQQGELIEIKISNNIIALINGLEMRQLMDCIADFYEGIKNENKKLDKDA